MQSQPRHLCSITFIPLTSSWCCSGSNPSPNTIDFTSALTLHNNLEQWTHLISLSSGRSSSYNIIDIGFSVFISILYHKVKATTKREPKLSFCFRRHNSLQPYYTTKNSPEGVSCELFESITH